jgi:hypothetical protein
MNLKVKTTPENVAEANWGLFRSTMNLPAAAAHCGMTQKEMKMTFREFLKYHHPDWDTSKSVPVGFDDISLLAIIDETQGGF